MGCAIVGFQYGLFFIAIRIPALVGPLGIAILLGATSYYLSKFAEKNESKPLERWAKRCFFGKSNDNWRVPEYADIALSELNAATLGLDTSLKFETSPIGPVAASKIGGPISLDLEQKIKFCITLPRFAESKSGYTWRLVIHRAGDGQPPHYTGGEVVASEVFHAPAEYLTALFTRPLSPARPPRFPDYKKDSVKINSSDHVASKHGAKFPYKNIVGEVDVFATLHNPNILGATLSVAYWVDRGVSDAYAGMLLTDLNE
ncbi:hypothetical protein IRZ70_23475 [Pseudomonas monteilii]|nr:hypothetical protein [Pseudomonas monteilii]